MFSMQSSRAAAFRDGFLERVEIDHQQIDRRDGMRLRRGLVRGIAADRQQAAMHLRMQRLQTAVHHFGEAGVLGDVLDGNAGRLERGRGAAGRQDLDTR